MVPRARLAALVGAAASVLVLAPGARAAGAPKITDSWASAVAATAADLRATIDPGEAETKAKVEYLTLAAFQANGFNGATSSPVGGTSIGSGATPVAYLRHLINLKPNTAYRYRIVATNSEGTASGPERTIVTQGTAPAFALPDSRGWEMVSPVDKNGGEVQGPGAVFGGGTFQAAADGSALTYSSTFSFAGGQGAPGASQYVSRRNSAGWDTENVTLPTEAGAYGTDPEGAPYQLFSGDLGRGLMLQRGRCASEPCPRGYLLRQSAGGALIASPEATDMELAGASHDLSQTVLSTQSNLYRWSGGTLTAVNLLPGDTTPTPGAELAAQGGAVSADGSRVYFTLAGNLYLRQGAQTFQVDEAVGGGGSFELASADGAIAFFSKGGHLYRYPAGGSATDLTPGGGVEGVLGASADAAYLYYLAADGLYLRSGANTAKVADAADASNHPPATGSARVAANGNLAFLAAADLTGADTGGHSQVYLYAPGTGALTCVSCNPNGVRPLGPSTIPGARPNGTGASATRMYKPRALSAAGNRLFFDSADALVATDTNNDTDVYEWEAQGVGSCAVPGGCLALISSGRAVEGATFLDASADGSDAFFLTDESLVPTDPGVVDVYDARVGGGFPVAPAPIPCVADACQVVPPEPEDPTPGTAFYRNEGNPPLTYPKAGAKKKPKKHKKKKRRGKAQTKAAAKKGGRR